MAKGRELTIEERARIKALHDAGWSYRKIASDLKCSLSTINYTLNKIKSTKSYANRPRTGRKRKLSKKDAHVLKLLSLRDRKKSSKQQSDEINKALPQGTTIASSTTRRYLREEGLFGRVAIKKPLLRRQNRIKRLRFAKQHKDWTKDDWNKVLWTDESKFELFGTNRTLEGFMCGDEKVNGSLMTAFPLQSNMAVGMLWFGVLFLEPDWAVW